MDLEVEALISPQLDWQNTQGRRKELSIHVLLPRVIGLIQPLPCLPFTITVLVQMTYGRETTLSYLLPGRTS